MTTATNRPTTPSSAVPGGGDDGTQDLGQAFAEDAARAVAGHAVATRRQVQEGRDRGRAERDADGQLERDGTLPDQRAHRGVADGGNERVRAHAGQAVGQPADPVPGRPHDAGAELEGHHGHGDEHAQPERDDAADLASEAFGSMRPGRSRLAPSHYRPTPPGLGNVLDL
jgi:hypothetical protein